MKPTTAKEATSVKSSQQHHRTTLSACMLFALILNCLLLQAFSEASSAKYIYNNQEPAFGIEQLAKLIGIDREEQADLSSIDEVETSNSILDSGNAINLGGYFVPKGQQEHHRHRLLDDPIVANKLADYLKQQREEEHDVVQESSEIPAVLISGEINAHLPARGFQRSAPSDLLISGPVNDPADFEAALSTLTNTINHELPNSRTRDEMLNSLMSGYSGDMMTDVHQRQQQQDNNIESEGSSDSNSHNHHGVGRGESSQSSTTPASRYGGGEYIDHPLALIGHQYVQGGAGEGKQLLGPDGTFENVQVVKTDHAVPSYCDPPNPCPIGYTAEDRCLEKFVNSASFSREYQARQQCSCDNEHSLFNCASPISTLKGQSAYSPSSSPKPTSSAEEATTGSDGDSEASNQDSSSPNFNLILESGGSSSPEGAGDSMDSSTEMEALGQAAVENKLDTLARTIQNRFGSLANIRNLISQHRVDVTRGY